MNWTSFSLGVSAGILAGAAYMEWAYEAQKRRWERRHAALVDDLLEAYRELDRHDRA